MKLSFFNRPHMGIKTGLDPLAICAGVIMVSGVVSSYPWFFIGG